MSKNNMKQVTDNFVEEIKASKEYKSYQKALSEFKAEESTQKLLSDLREAQQTLLVFRQGGFTGVEKQEKKVKWLKEKVDNNKIIQDLSKTQNEFQLLIFNLADTISRGIGFQFAPPQKGGCCG